MMLFSSISFLYYFLPVVLILYFIVPKALRNWVLLIASLFFYAFSEPRYVFLLLGEILAGYISGLFLDHSEGRTSTCPALIFSLFIPIGLLIYFKYTTLPSALPVGISFYTFQIISYQVDVYLGKLRAERNFVTLALYVAMFPQLIAGPIVRYTDIKNQFYHRKADLEAAAEGIRRFLIGLSKKLLLANRLGTLCSAFRASDTPSVLFLWMYAIAFTLQIYFDFSGYSDMALGLARIFGFRLPENFNYPYTASSITDFWRRWHISLGSWFRDYIYIPLGGNKVSRSRWFFNVVIVWLLTGLWHGASLNFILWGLLFALLLALEKCLLTSHLNKHPYLCHIYVLFFVLLSFVIFNASDVYEAVDDIRGMFFAASLPVISDEAVYYMRSYVLTLMIGCIGATPWPNRLLSKIRSTAAGEKYLNFIEPWVLMALLCILTAYMIDSAFQPFLYFRF